MTDATGQFVDPPPSSCFIPLIASDFPCLCLPLPPRPRCPRHDDHLCMGRESLLDGLFCIGREDDDSVVMLNALEKMSRFRVRVSIVGIVACAACAKQHISLIEEEDRPTGNDPNDRYANAE